MTDAQTITDIYRELTTELDRGAVAIVRDFAAVTVRYGRQSWTVGIWSHPFPVGKARAARFDMRVRCGL